MQSFSYLTILKPSEGFYKEKGSKFLAFAFPVSTEIEAKENIERLKKEYYDARHHCYAWMLGTDKKYFRAFDDGEPNHTAGDPILGQIKSKNLTNILIVVVRYFGGTKLGVGGLITAYKAAAEDALKNAIIVEEDVTEIFQLKYNYASTPEVMRLVKEFGLSITDQKFDDDCMLCFNLRTRDKYSITERIKLFQAIGINITLTEIRQE
jgi:uncharacterized YigZ family protein